MWPGMNYYTLASVQTVKSAFWSRPWWVWAKWCLHYTLVHFRYDYSIWDAFVKRWMFTGTVKFTVLRWGWHLSTVFSSGKHPEVLVILSQMRIIWMHQQNCFSKNWASFSWFFDQIVCLLCSFLSPFTILSCSHQMKMLFENANFLHIQVHWGTSTLRPPLIRLL